MEFAGAVGSPVLSTIRDIIRVDRRTIYIDNAVFRLHYRWAVIAILAFAMSVASRQYIGDPIDCLTSGDVKKIADEYCWIHSTFTRGKIVKKKWTYEPVEEMEIYPGVRPANIGDDIVFHTYYQWVWCVLLLQACAFYFPHWIWEQLENGRTKILVANLNMPMLPEDKKVNTRDAILEYFIPNRGYHTKYAFYYVMCEFLNLSNVIIHIVITDYFLNNEFSKYGFRLFELTQTRPYLRDDTLARIFPTVTSCRIPTGGVAFGVVQHDVLCVLPINIINEKIFIFLWFLFIVLTLASIGGLAYRLITIIFPRIRKYLLRRLGRQISNKVLNIICVNSTYGDWFLIHNLGQNIDQVAFSDLIEELAQSFARNPSFTNLSGQDGAEKIPFEMESDP